MRAKPIMLSSCAAHPETRLALAVLTPRRDHAQGNAVARRALEEAATRIACRSVEFALQAYFLVALLSTSGLDNLVFLTFMLAALVAVGKLAATAKRPAVSISTQVAQLFN